MKVSTLVPLLMDVKQLAYDTWTLVQDLIRAINGSLGFGDGTNADNIRGQWVTVTTHGTADTEFAVAHTLGVVPVGFIIMVPPKSGYLYNGGTTWTSSNIYLKCTGTSQTVTLFILPSSV
jgi:hypothetical protein